MLIICTQLELKVDIGLKFKNANMQIKFYLQINFNTLTCLELCLIKAFNIKSFKIIIIDDI